MRDKISQLSETLLAQMEQLTDEELFQRLKAGEGNAWQYVYLRFILPVIRNQQTSRSGIFFHQILRDKFKDEEDVYSDLFYLMTGQNKLDLYDRRGSLRKWMEYYIRKIIYNYCKKNPSTLSENYLDSVYTNKTPVRETAEINQVSFAKLWKENPMKAYVFLLKHEEIYSSEEIRKILGLTTANNVDRIFSRAKEDMADYVKLFSGEER